MHDYWLTVKGKQGHKQKSEINKLELQNDNTGNNMLKPKKHEQSGSVFQCKGFQHRWGSSSSSPAEGEEDEKV